MENKRKLLFFDIDGTLLTPYPFTVPESTKKALTLARQNGHMVFINTGRTIGMVPKEIQELPFDGFVCGCGTQILLNGEMVHYTTLPHDLCAEAVENMRKWKISAIYECRNRLLYDGTAPVEPPNFSFFRNLYSTADLSAFEPEEAASYTFDKFLALLHPESDKEAFLEYGRRHFNCFYHGHSTYELAQKNSSKATGIEFLLNHFQLNREDSFAFGDSENDLAMLKYAGTSVAMGNSRDSILPYCSYQTTDVDKDGIYNALKHFGLIENSI